MMTESEKAVAKPRLERWMEALLDPKTIHNLLGLGGALCILGVIVWLASLGIFKNAIVLAGCLIAGTAVLLSIGLFLATKTPYRFAGNAVAFLACVLAPLNLWFLHAQNLITIENHLWLGGVICSIVFACVVRLLREPFHVYAVEIGATLTVLLLLADLNKAADPIMLSLAGVMLAAVSIHSIRAFPSGEGTFTRERFFAPLFWSGHMQMAMGLAVLSASQLFGGMPTLGRFGLEWFAGGFSDKPWLAGLVWSASAYLYYVSHRLFNFRKIFASAAAICGIFAVLSIVNPYLGVDGRIIAYSIASLVFVYGVRTESGDKTLRELAIAASMTLGMLATAALVLRVNRHEWYSAIEIGWPLLIASVVTAVSQLLSARYSQIASKTVLVCQSMLAGVALAVSIHVARLVLVTDTVSYAVQGACMAIPATIGVILALRMPQVWQLPLTIASLTTMLVATVSGFSGAGTMVAIASPKVTNETSVALAFLAAQFAFVTGGACAVRRHPFLMGLSGLGITMTLWLGLGVVGIPRTYFASAIAGLGLVTVAISKQSQAQSSRRAVAIGIGRAMILIASLSTAFQTIPYMFEAAHWKDISGFALVAAICAAASRLDVDPLWRRTFRSFAIICGIGVLLDFNAWLDIAAWRKAELGATIVGMAIVFAAYWERFAETGGKHSIPGMVWFGALAAVVPALIGAMHFRFEVGRASMPEELLTLTSAIVLTATGLAWRFKSTTIVGMGSLLVYLGVMIGQLAYHPQVAIGVYLAVGGAILFAAAALLATFRDTLLRIPEAIEKRSGVFQVLDWK